MFLGIPKSRHARANAVAVGALLWAIGCGDGTGDQGADGGNAHATGGMADSTGGMADSTGGMADSTGGMGDTTGGRQDSGMPAMTGGEQAGVHAPTATERLFADDAPVWHFDLTVDESDWTWLNNNPTLEQYVDAAVEHEGQRNGDAMVRYKGAQGSLRGCIDDSGELTCNKLSLKVSFNETNKDNRFLGVRKLIFHACARDASCLREQVSYGVFRAAGITTCRTASATVSINGGPPSLYVLVEYIDKEFLEDHFEDDKGNLYKEAWPASTNASRYLNSLRTNEAVGDVTRMTEFSAVLAAAAEDSFEAEVSPFMDTARMATYNAVDQLINNWDGIWKFYCFNGQCGNHNFYIYDDPTSHQLVVIPWDLDHTFTSPNSEMGREYWDMTPGICEPEDIGLTINGQTIQTRPAQCDLLMAGLMKSGWQNYRAQLQALLDGPRTSLEATLARLNRYRAVIREAVAADPLPPTVQEWEADVAKLRQIIIASYAEAERFLAEAP